MVVRFRVLGNCAIISSGRPPWSVRETYKVTRIRDPWFRGATDHCFYFPLCACQRTKRIGNGGAIVAGVYLWACCILFLSFISLDMFSSVLATLFFVGASIGEHLSAYIQPGRRTDTVSLAAQQTATVVCVAGQCVQGYTNLTSEPYDPISRPTP